MQNWPKHAGLVLVILVACAHITLSLVYNLWHITEAVRLSCALRNTGEKQPADVGGNNETLAEVVPTQQDSTEGWSSVVAQNYSNSPTADVTALATTTAPISDSAQRRQNASQAFPVTNRESTTLIAWVTNNDLQPKDASKQSRSLPCYSNGHIVGIAALLLITFLGFFCSITCLVVAFRNWCCARRFSSAPVKKRGNSPSAVVYEARVCPQLLHSIQTHAMLSLIYEHGSACHKNVDNAMENPEHSSTCDVAELIHRTWAYDKRLGKDAVGLNHSGIAVRRIYKIMNRARWVEYRRETLMMMAPQRQPLELLNRPILSELAVPAAASRRCKSELKGSVVVAISQDNDSDMTPGAKRSPGERRPLCGNDGHHTRNLDTLGAGEAYLFHGTLAENVTSIIENGFDLSKARKGLYGQAIYLAESSEKSDQYADTYHSRRKNNLTMLVVRTALGTVKVHSVEGPGRLPVRGALGLRCKEHDSILAGVNKRFREFLIFDARQCYPEFLVIYDRT